VVIAQHYFQLLMNDSAKLDDLRAESARLISLLEAHGINWRTSPDPVLAKHLIRESELSKLSPDKKVALFMRLFRGRTDVYPIRWESKAGLLNCVAGCALRLAALWWQIWRHGVQVSAADVQHSPANSSYGTELLLCARIF